MVVKSRYENVQQLKNTELSPLADPYAIVPATGFARLDQILQLIPISKNAWWIGVREGRFPPSIKLGHRTTVWKAEDIHQLIADIAGGE